VIIVPAEGLALHTSVVRDDLGGGALRGRVAAPWAGVRAEIDRHVLRKVVLRLKDSGAQDVLPAQRVHITQLRVAFHPHGTIYDSRQTYKTI